MEHKYTLKELIYMELKALEHTKMNDALFTVSELRTLVHAISRTVHEYLAEKLMGKE